MPFGRSTIGEIKMTRPFTEERDRSRGKRVASTDVASQHSYIGGSSCRPHSADSRRTKEGDVASLLTGRKRKAGLMDEGSKSPVAGLSSLSFAQIVKPRRHKVAKCSASVTNEATDNQPTQSTTHMPSRYATLSTEEDSATRLGRVLMTSTKQRKARSLTRSVPVLGPDIHVKPEVEGLKKDILKLQKQVELSRKAAANQAQAMEDLKRELSAIKKMSRKQVNQIDKLKASGKKSEDILNTIQGHLQCQICLEFLLKPFTLVAPFINEAESTFTDLTFDPDPWRGIFPSEIDILDEDDTYDEFADAYDSDADSASSIDARYLGLRIFSDEDDGDEENENSESGLSSMNMVLPAWAPAFCRATVTRSVYPHLSVEHFQLLQRGATLPMVERWSMRLETEEGIVAWLESGAELYLGWNIILPEDDHPDGRGFMAWVENSIVGDPESWLCDNRDHSLIYRRLVPEDVGTEILGPDSDDESDDGL
ncbi:hypothetical protein EW145_g1378 [Phellinidium pouzarii]|uniref:DUF8191 domain-containing protein n=1 Tax=Phellinidium pouzarii TaxID=167371 RepID=A0A4S4LEN5_9AGAM|nr:hypothetical protein EW145_g1378 [Phellinidium pouzarii]